MRRLRTLHRDPVARAAVAKAAKGSEDCDSMSFGLLCYESGRVAGRAELEEEVERRLREAAEAVAKHAMNQYIYVRPRDDGQGWAVDVYDGRRAWSKTHLGESPLNKAEAHRVAHKLRDPKFYSARTKRAVNSGAREGMGEARVGTMPGSGVPLPHPPFGMSDGEAREAARVRAESFCACGRRLPECDGSRAGCLGSTGEPGVRDTKNTCDMFSPGKPTNGGCQGDGHYLCRECGLFDDRGEG